MSEKVRAILFNNRFGKTNLNWTKQKRLASTNSKPLGFGLNFKMISYGKRTIKDQLHLGKV